MQQTLSDNWTLDVGPAFSRRETDDGFTVFERPGMEIWAVIYCEQSFDADKAVRSFLDWTKPAKSDVAFRRSSDGIAGRAVLTNEQNAWTLTAVAASHGRIIKLDFRFPEQGQVDSAVAIWHSLKCSVPAWVEMCGRASPPLAELREALERGIDVEEAIEGIEERGQVGDAIPVLLEASKSDTQTVRQSTCEALGLIGDTSDEVLAALRARLNDRSVQVRAWSADALLDLGEPAETIVPFMIEGLQKNESPIPKGEGRVQGICRYLCAPDRYHAARVLSSVGEAARPARKVLLEYQMDESGGVRERVAEALLNLGEPLSDVLHPLLDGLHSQDMSERERMRFIEPLLKHGIPHEQLLPSLIRIISESSDFSTKVEALEVLGKMGRSALSAAETIEEAISEKSDEFDIKINAVQALTRIGAKESVATPILLSALDEELDSDVKAEILHDLSRIESLNKGTLDRILTELDDDDSSVRAAAAFVLAKNKVQIVRCLKILSKTLDEVDDEVRWRAAVALGSIGSSAESTVDQLVQFVRKEQSREIRLSGIWAIGQIGKYSNELKPLFSKISENADDDERRIIDKALRCLESNEQ